MYEKPSVSRRAFLGGILAAGSVAALGMVGPPAAASELPKDGESDVPQLEYEDKLLQPAEYEKTQSQLKDLTENITRLHTEMAGKTPEEILSLADEKFAAGQSTITMDKILQHTSSAGFGLAKGGLLTIDAAFLYASVYPLIDDEKTRAKLRAAITACHGIFTAVPLAASKLGYEQVEAAKQSVLTGVGLATLAGIFYLKFRNGDEPEPEDFAEAAAEDKLKNLIIAMPVVLVSVDAMSAGFGGSTSMETQDFNVTDYAISTAATLVAIYGILKLQDSLMTRHKHKIEDSDDDSVSSPRTLTRFAAKAFGLNPESEELKEEAWLTAASAMISSYAFRGVLSGANLDSKNNFLGFTGRSVGLGVTFAAALNHLGNFREHIADSV